MTRPTLALALAAVLASTLLFINTLGAAEAEFFQPSDDLFYLESGATATIPVLDNDGRGARAVVACGGATRGQVDCSDGRHIRYYPDGPFLGIDTFTYTARGRGWRTVSARVQVVFVDAPAAHPFDDVFTVETGKRTLLDVRANDKIASWATPETVADPTLLASHHRLNQDPTTGHLAFRPEPGFTGRVVFAYRLVDASRSVASAPAYVTLEVRPEGADSPVATADGVVVRRDTPQTIPVLGNDHDPTGQGLEPGHWDTVSQQGGTVEAGPGGTLVYTPPEGFVGMDEWTYFAVDAAGRTSNRTLVVLAVENDEPPIAANDFAVTPEDKPVTLDLLANDVDPEGLSLTVSALTSPFYGTAVLGRDGTVRYTPAPDRSGVDFFTYTARDAGGQTDSARVTLSITPVDDPPDAQPDAATTDEEIGVIVPVLANDRDPEYAPLALISVGPAASGTPRIEPDQTLFYMPDPDFFGIDTFDYTVSDGGLESTTTVTVTVHNRPDPPLAVDDTASTRAGEAVTLDVLANDIDPDRGTLTLTCLVQGTGGTATQGSDGTVDFTPATGFVGQAFFEYCITNSSGLQDGALAIVEVVPDGTPRALPDEASTLEDWEVRIDVLANDWDPGGDALALVSVGPAASGTPRIDLGPDLYPTVLFEPAPDFFGVDTFDYTISDGSSTATATVTVTVEPVPDFPVLVDDAAQTSLDTALPIAVLANDRDPDGGTLEVIGHSPAMGTLVLQTGGTFLYTPPPGFLGTDAFFYTARSSSGMEGTARVEIQVLPGG